MPAAESASGGIPLCGESRDPGLALIRWQATAITDPRHDSTRDQRHIPIPPERKNVGRGRAPTTREPYPTHRRQNRLKEFFRSKNTSAHIPVMSVEGTETTLEATIDYPITETPPRGNKRQYKLADNLTREACTKGTSEGQLHRDPER
ncbi:hypothetical protein ABVT39_014091 [Epinephelus coioides]